MIRPRDRWKTSKYQESNTQGAGFEHAPLRAGMPTGNHLGLLTRH